mgnify:CR=1 FL=1
MPEIIWVDDVPMPVNPWLETKQNVNFDTEKTEHYEDSDWYNDPNCVMSRHHY